MPPRRAPAAQHQDSPSCHQGTCSLLKCTRESPTAHRYAIRIRGRVRTQVPRASSPLLTCDRKSWRQLDDFHSLTDLKIHISSHKEPQVTAGLRSVCWKVCYTSRLSRPTRAYRLARSSSCSKPSTARHGHPTSPTPERRTNPCARTIYVRYSTLMSLSPP